ncbi:MAG: DUF885 family protein [Acidobacteria bacterium]|nr:DUF885 family protein [Acidobacteriota bacterium]
MRKRPVVLVLALVMAACAAEAPAPESGPQLDALVDDYIALVGQRSSGWDPTTFRADGSPDLSPERFDADLEPRRALLRRLEALPVDGLALPERTDHTAMLGFLRTDLYSAERRRPTESEPLLYVPVGAVSRLFPDPELDLAVDQARAATLLAAIPSALDQGKTQLGEPAQRVTNEAIFQVRATLANLDSNLLRLEGDAATAGAAASAALTEYLRFLEEDLLPRSTGSWAIGKQHYDYILETRWGMSEDADDIIAMGRAAFAETVAEAQVVAERIAPGSDWVEVYEELKRDHPTAEGLKDAYQEQMDAAQQFVYEQRVLTLPEGEAVITVDTPPAMRRSSPFGTFDSVGPEDDHLQGRLVLTPIEEGLTPEQHEARLSAHHTAWVPIIAVHEAYPGHHAQALKVYENPRRLRHYVRESIFSEGWGLFTEQLMFELGFLQGDDVKLTQLRNRLWRAARVILDASLHTGQMTFDEAVDFLVEEVRFDRVAAELEAGMYTGRPTYFLGYLIGSMKIEEMRDDWVAIHGEPTEPRELWDRLLTIGSLPPALVRAELFAE